MTASSIRGRFLWHELLTIDTKAAAAFYSKVVGWKAETYPDNPAYMLWMSKGGPMGGLMILPAEAKAMGAPPHWMTYVGTPDLAETIALAQRLGGRILKDVMDIPTVGRFAVLADPQGAAFTAYTPSGAAPPESPTPRLGDFSWHELATSDPVAALRFYQELFGWEKMDGMDMGPEIGIYQLYGWGGKSMGGIYKLPAQVPAPPNWLPYIHIADARTATTVSKALGAQVLNGPMEVPGGDWISMMCDPQGVAFAVHSRKPVPKAAKAPAKAKKRKAAAKASRKVKARKPAKATAAKRKPVRKAALKKKAVKKGDVKARSGPKKRAGARKRR